jgi:hypothetical protein
MELVLCGMARAWMVTLAQAIQPADERDERSLVARCDALRYLLPDELLAGANAVERAEQIGARLADECFCKIPLRRSQLVDRSRDVREST